MNGQVDAGAAPSLMNKMMGDQQEEIGMLETNVDQLCTALGSVLEISPPSTVDKAAEQPIQAMPSLPSLIGTSTEHIRRIRANIQELTRRLIL